MMKKTFSNRLLVKTCWVISISLLVSGCSLALPWIKRPPRRIIPPDYSTYEREDGSRARSLLRSAEDRFQRGDIQGAYQEAAQAISFDRSLADAYLLMGRIFFLIKNLKSADVCFRNCLFFNPKNAQAHYYFGLIRRQENDDDGAITEFKKAIEIAPLFAAAHFQLGAIYYKQKQLVPAEAEFAVVVFVKPDDTMAQKYLSNLYFTFGWQAFSEGDYLKARDYFLESFAKNSANVKALLYLGHTYLRIPHFAEAAEQFQEMLKYAPDSQEARKMLDSISRKWQFSPARPALPGKAAVPPIMTPAQRELSNNYLTRGRNSFSSGDYLKAREYFQKSLEENSANLNALYFLGYTYLRIPHFSEAAEQMNEMLRRKPDSKEAKKALNGIYLRWEMNEPPEEAR